MSVEQPPLVRPDWTLGELRAKCPGVELTLFSHFGIGSRERSGFSGKELLGDLLRRHLVFDAEKACTRLTELAKEDWKHALTPEMLVEMLPTATLVDCRGREEHELSSLEGTRYLTGALVQELTSSTERASVVLLCNDGSQAPAASRLLRKQGLTAYHLWGGLAAWSERVDRTFPVLYPLVEQSGGWYLLADGRTLRHRLRRPRGRATFRSVLTAELERAELGQLLAWLLPQLEAVYTTPWSIAFRGNFTSIPPITKGLSEDLLESHDWEKIGSVGDEAAEVAAIEQVLKIEAPDLLASHKGTVEMESYRDRVLTLALGGGCSGCASAQITAKRELAALLYRRVPLIDKIVAAEV